MDSTNCGFVDVDNLREVDSKLNNALKEFSTIPNDALLNTLPVLDENDGEMEDAVLLKNELSKYDEYMKVEHEFLKEYKCDKLDYLLDIYCYLDKDSKKFTKEEF
mmetsp:Transcript_12407/g.27008  ORF Transcript_12407/g.27008 Transcript_12407/m.27008 type:complete len:105 (-) Transcript_12407:441-755(-)|eukprot:CAMPEP_0116909016 /NCGR_PEP_ID=MMETSP0467-20121206/14023_1 /TAXON_ID=283647 /ORGANISM="Mesodinium pulex, Strain SPMC105" /LENGTH=104 /DNA_ID=CAMNT_0004584291 /DNA_START=550 /DNA_END=864 /DNA_ORIENTATION=-